MLKAASGDCGELFGLSRYLFSIFGPEYPPLLLHVAAAFQRHDVLPKPRCGTTGENASESPSARFGYLC